MLRTLVAHRTQRPLLGNWSDPRWNVLTPESIEKRFSINLNGVVWAVQAGPDSDYITRQSIVCENGMVFN